MLGVYAEVTIEACKHKVLSKVLPMQSPPANTCSHACDRTLITNGTQRCFGVCLGVVVVVVLHKLQCELVCILQLELALVNGQNCTCVGGIRLGWSRLSLWFLQIQDYSTGSKDTHRQPNPGQCMASLRLAAA